MKKKPDEVDVYLNIPKSVDQDGNEQPPVKIPFKVKRGSFLHFLASCAPKSNHEKEGNPKSDE